MNLLSKEHYELLEMFEQQNKHLRAEREPKELWRMGHIYQDGQTNNLFNYFRSGYALGKAIQQN